MSTSDFLFVGSGIVVAIGGVYVFLTHRKPDDDAPLRQTGLAVFTAGLAMVALTEFATRMPPLSH